jgi:two-component system response regulator YesN
VRVLLVDPFAAIRARLVSRLVEEGFEVTHEVASVLAAIDAALEHPPEAILTDVVLPDRRGAAVVSALRAHVPEAPILVLSNATHFATVCLAAGAAGFFDKSREIDKALATLQAMRRARHGSSR